ncbi:MULTISPECIES: hypothetical protein [unclassified Streptomyces]|uniref:hypothetical protein n=1 Tax=Streptomyces TaxID=1883 RepID=UPI000A0942FB|nr:MULTISPECIES: hypothetical protein [unclassified Streptomyces]ARI55364.1 hypothetical protein A6E92_26745 [Streptomyces sp. S8]MYU00153.1 hypothetical protein [Streptomyces sp. SID8350]NGO82538.1 hypothetical protein [Streptomyces sp. 196(2019)]
MPQTSFDAVCERMIAHSKAVGGAPRQGQVYTNSFPIAESWLEAVGADGPFPQAAAGWAGPG